MIVSAVCCQLEVSATSWSLVQRNPRSRNLKNEENMARLGPQSPVVVGWGGTSVQSRTTQSSLLNAPRRSQ